MSWFEKLKELVKININLENIRFFDIHINNNNTSDRVEYRQPEKIISLNLEKLTPSEREQVKQIVQEKVRQDDQLLIEKNSQERIKDIDSEENSDRIKPLLAYFKNKIPKDDYTALRAALHVRERFRRHANKEEILNLREEITGKFGKRGRSISILCSAGYFESLIKPIYEIMSADPDFSNKDFLAYYDVIISEEAFAVFVSEGMTKDAVRHQIKMKIQKNLKYGIKVVTIHGMGRTNVETINEVVRELQDETPTMLITISEKNNIIKVQLKFT
jgi:hypothetical protein